MRLFREQDVDQLVAIRDAIEAVEQAFVLQARGEATNRPRERVGGPGQAWLHVMPAAIWAWRLMGFKAYVSGPAGSRFMLFLFDAKSGEPVAAIEAGRLGQLRTGAASAVASRRMARPDSHVMALIGAGYQAETQLEAISAVLPLRKVYVVSRSPERARAFCQRMAPKVPDVELWVAESAEQAVREADVVTTITSSRTPVLRGEWLRPGTHINAAGSNHAARQELDPQAVLRANRVVVDDLEQARKEAGDLIAAEPHGFAWSSALELAAVVAGLAPGRLDASEITLFESQGLALEDVALAHRILEKAGEQPRPHLAAWESPTG